jgi:hypothetical protein
VAPRGIALRRLRISILPFLDYSTSSLITWTYLDRVSEAARASCAAAELKLRSSGRAYYVCCSMFFSRTEIGSPDSHGRDQFVTRHFFCEGSPHAGRYFARRRAMPGRHFASQPAVTKALAEAR